MGSKSYENRCWQTRMDHRDYDKEWFVRILTLIERNFPVTAESRVIDFNCSACEMIEVIYNKWQCSCVAADFIKAATDYAKSLGNESFSYDGCDINTLPLKYTNRFDIAISTESIEHITDLDSFFSIVNTALKPNGIFLLTTPNSSSYKHWIHYLYTGTVLSEGHHYRFLNRAIINQLITMNGFDVIDELHYETNHPIVRLFSFVVRLSLRTAKPLFKRFAGLKYFDRRLSYLPEFRILDWGFALKKDEHFPPIGTSHWQTKSGYDINYVLKKIQKKLVEPGWMSEVRYQTIKQSLLSPQD